MANVIEGKIRVVAGDQDHVMTYRRSVTSFGRKHVSTVWIEGETGPYCATACSPRQATHDALYWALLPEYTKDEFQIQFVGGNWGE